MSMPTAVFFMGNSIIVSMFVFPQKASGSSAKNIKPFYILAVKKQGKIVKRLKTAKRTHPPLR